MPQSLAKVAVHLVFSTKNREPWFRDPQLRDELYAYMATILRDNVDSPAILIGGVADHVHALILMSRKFAIMDIIKEAKTETSKWLKLQPACTKKFSWQAGYGAFSVSESNIKAVKKYIAGAREASSTDDVSGRAPRAVPPAWVGVGRAVRVGLVAD